MAILVTGGAGYIGSHMVLSLQEAGEAVVVLDDLSTGFADVVPSQASLVVGDIGDRAALDAVFKNHSIDTVIHFAAKTIVPESIREPALYYETNAFKALRLFAAACESGVNRIILSSTAAVYGITDRTVVSETDETRPVTPYGASKLMAERILKDICVAGGMSYGILRYFNVAGADPACRIGQRTLGATHLIKAACEASMGLRPELVVHGNDYPTPDGTGVRDFIHVSDLVDAHLRSLEQLRAGCESFTANCGYGRGFSVLDVVSAVQAVSGREVPLRFGPRRPGDLAEVVAANERLREVTGWTPRCDDLKTIVMHALAWEEKLRSLARDHSAG